MVASQRSEILGYALLFVGVAILLFTVFLAWAFMNGTLGLPTIWASSSIDPAFGALLSLILVIALLVILAFIGSFFVRNGSDHLTQRSD